MTDARFSGGSVGLVMSHLAPEAFLGGPIALVEDDDTIVFDLNDDRIDCLELNRAEVRSRRFPARKAAAHANGGVHPDARPVGARMLRRTRATARPALLGGGMSSRDELRVDVDGTVDADPQWAESARRQNARHA